ncbi:hypothetical protein NCAS_0H03490 [Naumovozyma castellii]|uniref:Orc1-like AAA ATPase domain-containing protein n=1 Tax=Naumovozyma castellii TaxID=27288 RepID=G0VJI0_NAUCA|nr:hypothetical protein NCAS_0H03490 [Naumovozyma castellii CBS 4309]CCC71659.1 hypothetical protein NCAS_0H03490 [Naumovozyma castellii CBS 4309]
MIVVNIKRIEDNSTRQKMAQVPGLLFRESQLNLLNAFITDDPSTTASNLVLQGCNGSGKAFTIRKFFEHYHPNALNVWVYPIELVSWRPLLQAVTRLVQKILKSRYPSIHVNQFDPMEVEELYQFVKALHFILNQYNEHIQETTNLFITLDGFDTLFDLDLILLVNFLKLHELLSQDSKVQLKFIYLIEDESFLSKYATYMIPTITFPRYDQNEILEILLLSRGKELMNAKPFQMALKDLDINDDEQFNIMANFIQLITQSFHSYTGNDISALNDLIDSKWEQYISYMNERTIMNPIQLYRASVKLFISTDESLCDDDQEEEFTINERKEQTYDLSIMSKYLLMAAYICSYLGQKYDRNIFSRKTNITRGRGGSGRRKKQEINPRYLQASLFHLERLLAIFQAIYPKELETVSGSLASLGEDNLMRANVEVFQNLAELHSLKLIATTTAKNIDFLNYKVKWKVNVPWEIIEEISNSLDFDIGQYFNAVHE